VLPANDGNQLAKPPAGADLGDGASRLGMPRASLLWYGHARMTPLQAELYALTHRGNAGDRAFYERVCAGAERVLELGCGYGRLLGMLADQERQVVGLERDAELRALARRWLRESGGDLAARVRVISGDMRKFSLGSHFDRIVIPHSGVYCLLDRASVIACFRCVERHLAPRGRLVFDAYAADAFHVESSPTDLAPDALEPVVSLRARGGTWDVFEQSRWTRRAQRLEVTYVYVRRERPRVERIAIPQRYLLTGQIPGLLARAGLELVSLRRGFGQRANARAEHVIVEARARAPRSRPRAGRVARS